MSFDAKKLEEIRRKIPKKIPENQNVSLGFISRIQIPDSKSVEVKKENDEESIKGSSPFPQSAERIRVPNNKKKEKLQFEESVEGKKKPEDVPKDTEFSAGNILQKNGIKVKKSTKFFNRHFSCGCYYFIWVFIFSNE